jgi:quercetin dioxygenase-like cupin family protein
MVDKSRVVFRIPALPFLESADGTLRDSFMITEATCGSQQATAGIVFIRPHSRCHEDTHDVEELFYIIAGRGKLTFDDEPVEVEAGDVVFMPAHVAHRVVNESDETYVAFWAILTKTSRLTALNEEVKHWSEIEPNQGWSEWPYPKTTRSG